MADLAWLRALWAWVDDSLSALSRKLQRIVRMLRLVRALLILGILAVLGSAAVGIVWPQWFADAYAVAAVFLVIPLVMLAVLVALPLQAKSVIRLIDQGYPANARELGIRVAARKLRDQSIETEELLVETAMNEGRKVYERYKARAEMGVEADEGGSDDDLADGSSSGPSAPR